MTDVLLIPFERTGLSAGRFWLISREFIDGALWCVRRSRLMDDGEDSGGGLRSLRHRSGRNVEVMNLILVRRRFWWSVCQSKDKITLKM